VDDAMGPEKLQADKDLDGKATDQLFGEAAVVVADDEFVEVVAQEFENYADVLSEDYEIFYLYHVRLVVFVAFLYVTQDLDLDEGLL
jgi:hypothetical protein